MTRRITKAGPAGLAILASCVTGILAAPAPASGATAKVALVVQFGPNSKPVVSCVDYVKKMSGFDLLRAANHDIQYQAKTYQLLRIDGTPTPPKADSTHYWAYLYRTSTSDWTRYRQTGADAQPQPGTVEAWLYFNGKAYDAPDLTFDNICRASASTPRSSAAATASGRTAVAPATTSKPPPTVRATKATAHASTPATSTAATSFATPASAGSRTAAGLATESGGRPAQGAGPLVWVVLGGLALAAALAARAVHRMNSTAAPPPRHRK